MPTPNSQHYDVIIAGGPLRGRGDSDAAGPVRYGTDTLSTHALMHGAPYSWRLLNPVNSGGYGLVRRWDDKGV